MKVAAALLAAGRSTRFGAADKLAAPLDGLPLACHAAAMLARLPVATRIVVARADALAWPGFALVVNDHPEAGLAGSIVLAVQAARRAGADALLIALADMPFVSAGHVLRLLARHDGPGTLVASGDGTRRMPPALFGAGWFDALERLSGDQGARSLLDRAEIVVAPADELIDIDRPEDLVAAGTSDRLR